MLLSLVWKFFPVRQSFKKLVNKNRVKINYGCSENMEQMLNSNKLQ